MARECPREGCTRTPGSGMLACKPDWFRVSPATRSELWSIYRNEGIFSDAYMEIREQAIKEMNA